MFRLTGRLAAVLLRRPPAPPELPQPPRTPDPYVWALPSPHHARWRRWHRRNQSVPPAQRTTPFLPEEDCWRSPVATPPRPLAWTPHDDVVRPYVLRALGEEW
ncbi:hypothetical protein [Streptomyces turgidiscabies]|uniref:Secreted protein n=1 Tax=Streptomyces turgidiscabies TaxID=85558 RepID=A0ABU0RMH8_9ACTN|nr:hypothetical protein [Streptomyces turgidiscabies]MDQ0933185.1 hypothetical protein [Streptomyces turgidiscabies]